MKNLKIITAFLILTSFAFSCTPQAINDENPSEIVATGGDDDSTVIEDKDD